MTTKQKPSKKKQNVEKARAAQVAKMEALAETASEAEVSNDTQVAETPSGAEVTQDATEVADLTPQDAPQPPQDAPCAAVGMTLGQLADAYINVLGAAGKGDGTRMSYAIDLAVALKILGKETLVADITEVAVTAFFESTIVTKTRTGAPKAKVSIDKTRRVFRQAMDYALKHGFIATHPVAKAYTTRRGRGDA
jgi:hypothetical protein